MYRHARDYNRLILRKYGKLGYLDDRLTRRLYRQGNYRNYIRLTRKVHTRPSIGNHIEELYRLTGRL